MVADPPRSRAGAPWLSIIGIGADGLTGLTEAARTAINEADSVFGGKRHLVLAGVAEKGNPWPEPFDPASLLALRGRNVVALVSGDPFWFGAGSVLTRALKPGEWRAFPSISAFSLAAATLGWPLEMTPCLGLHAAPLEEIAPHLHPGARLLCLMRDGDAPAALAALLAAQGYGASTLQVMEVLGGPHQRLRNCRADTFDLAGIAAPVLVAIEVSGPAGLPATPGLPDALFAHDGQITKSPIRALTLSALAPRRGETLWDIGAGSGSVSVEWCRAGGRSFAVEARPDRAANIAANARRFGVARRLTLIAGRAPDALAGLPAPDAIFIGGGAGDTLLEIAWAALSPGGRLVLNAVTLESESLAIRAHEAHGGSLTRIDIAVAAPLGSGRGWQPSRPIVQWSTTK